MLLSRLAWKLYWIGCNVQRAEDNARVALAQKTIANRLGINTVPLTQEFLKVLDIYPKGMDDESRCMQYMLTDKDNPFSATRALEHTYTDVRSLRSLLPGDAQPRILVLRKRAAALANAGTTVLQERLEDFIRTTLAFAGVLSTGMLRDDGYLFWQVGRQLAAAEITCSLVHACLRCQSDVADETVSDSMLWVQVLNALGMLEAYRKFSRDPVDGAGAAQFISSENRIGHSVAASLAKATTAAAVLPNNAALLQSLSKCQYTLRSLNRRQANVLQSLLRLGSRIEGTMELVSKTYFPEL